MTIYDTLQEDQARASSHETRRLLGQLVQKKQYVGELYSLGYEEALALIHDFHRKRVGGIPSLSFLIASRLDPDTDADYALEDTSVILLRVMDAAALPGDAEAQRIRVETAQRVSGETEQYWDSPEAMDPHTNHLLSFAGVKCRVLGTFFVDRASGAETDDSLLLRFGSDLSNYYPNKGLKVYKPNGEALAAIVNYRDTERLDASSGQQVTVGQVRYASTNRSFQGVSNVDVHIDPGDLLGQKTALFGMTRSGKSNTTKIMAKAVFRKYPLLDRGKSITSAGRIP